MELIKNETSINVDTPTSSQANAQKMFAPKPVRANSNKFGMKVLPSSKTSRFSNFETLFQQKSALSPQPRKSHAARINSKIETSDNDTCFTKYCLTAKQGRFLFDCEIEEDSQNNSFEKKVEQDFKNLTSNDEEDLSKSEILSILRNDSTCYESTLFRSENLFQKDQEEDFTYERISLPPMRVSNPLYKNLDKELRKECHTVQFVRLNLESYQDQDDYFTQLFGNSPSNQC